LIGWYGCAASGPINVCYNDADSAEVKRSDGSLAIRLCTQADLDYEELLAPKTTITKVIAAWTELGEEMAAWDKKYGFKEGSGNRRALKMMDAHQEKNTLFGNLRRKMEEDSEDSGERRRFLTAHDESDHTDESDHASHDDEEAQKSGDDAKSGDDSDYAKEGHPDHDEEGHSDHASYESGDDEEKEWNESDYDKEIDNEEFEEYMEKLEEAFEALYIILGVPTIDVADFVDVCEYAMVYTFRYPLAAVP
jgi:hypothetical protein